MSSLYSKAKDRIARGEIAWKEGMDSFGVFLIDSLFYIPDILKDEYLSDIPNEARAGNYGRPGIEGAGMLNIISARTGGICDAENLLFNGMEINKVYEAIVIFKMGVDESQSPLLAYIDRGINLPIKVTSPQILIEWDEGPNKIFRL